MLDSELLMAVQYKMPISTTPIEDLADEIGRNPEDIIKKLREYRALGILKRYGANMNYRAFPNYRQSSLIGFKISEEKARKINELGERVKHNFLRDAEFNVWFTLKGRNVEEVRQIAEKLAKELGAEDFVFLPTKRVYKMDVKYDLQKGISWSYGVEPENVASLSELGLDEGIKILENLPISKRPFRDLGLDEEYSVDLIRELIKKGVVRDFSAVLSERGIGFNFNSMVVLKTRNPEAVAKKLLSFPQITHLIERIPSEKWFYPVYFMVHAVDRDRIESFAKRVLEIPEIEEMRLVYSRGSLKP